MSKALSKNNFKKNTWQPHKSPNQILLNKIIARGHRQQSYIDACQKNSLVLANGPAGTGKTYLAAAMAASALLSGSVERIIMSRPALEAGERLGFLPGDMREKVDPYLRPLYDALGLVIGADETERYIRAGLIEIAPLAFMRGRSLENAFVILDEAQNCTQAQMKMFLTRIGEGSTFVVCGDSQQSDLPKNEISGFNQALSLLARVEKVSTINFDRQDIQRSALVGEIVRAYEKEQKIIHDDMEAKPQNDIFIDVVRHSNKWSDDEVEAAQKAARTAIEMGLDNRANHISLSLVFADSKMVHDFNKRFRGKDQPTNVLAFPADQKYVLGDVIIAYEVLFQEAEDKKISRKAHAAHLAAHGTLHLLGFTHENDSDTEIMERLEIKLLQKQGFANPYTDDSFNGENDE